MYDAEQPPFVATCSVNAIPFMTVFKLWIITCLKNIDAFLIRTICENLCHLPLS